MRTERQRAVAAPRPPQRRPNPLAPAGPQCGPARPPDVEQLRGQVLRFDQFLIRCRRLASRRGVGGVAAPAAGPDDGSGQPLTGRGNAADIPVSNSLGGPLAGQPLCLGPERAEVVPGHPEDADRDARAMSCSVTSMRRPSRPPERRGVGVRSRPRGPRNKGTACRPPSAGAGLPTLGMPQPDSPLRALRGPTRSVRGLLAKVVHDLHRVHGDGRDPLNEVHDVLRVVVFVAPVVGIVDDP